MRHPHQLVLFFALLALSACSGGELVGVHVLLHKDGAGLVTTRALVTPIPGSSEAQAQGVDWQGRAGVACSQGTFRDIELLKLGDGGIVFDADLADARQNMRVKVKRGPDASWVKALVPDLEARRKMAKIYDPTGRTHEIGDTLRIEVSVPGEVFASGVRPAGRGVEAASEGKRAYLLIPVRTALEAGEDLEWSFSW